MPKVKLSPAAKRGHKIIKKAMKKHQSIQKTIDESKPMPHLTDDDCMALSKIHDSFSYVTIRRWFK